MTHKHELVSITSHATSVHNEMIRAAIAHILAQCQKEASRGNAAAKIDRKDLPGVSEGQFAAVANLLRRSPYKFNVIVFEYDDRMTISW